MERTGDLYGRLWRKYSPETIRKTGDFGKHDFTDRETEAINAGWILDAGCGSGRRSIYMSNFDPRRITLFDLSEANVELTRRMLDEATDTPFDVYQGDVLNLPLRDHSFDYVLCNGVLHHTTNPQGGFEELARLVKPGGWLRVGLYHPSIIQYPVHALRAIFRHVSVDTTDRFVTFLTPGNNERVIKGWMDRLKVPIREEYSIGEVRGWFESEDIELTKSMGSRTFKHYVGVKQR